MKIKSHANGIGEIFFTSDHHFGHQSVIAMCNRPFASVEEMDAAMIEQWNAVVRPRDLVWHLGDFAFRCEPERMKKIFARLNGQKHLIRGNHDRKHVQSLAWTSIQDAAHITVDGHRIHLSHYAHRVWPAQYRGAIHLYGHSHGRLPGHSTTMDVGVDAVGYLPLTLAHIKEKLAQLLVAPIPDNIDALDQEQDEAADFTV
ncbi:MAG TPA: metallophosphoesterase family protein [Ramlibacter sp.]|jgi:calcineurin-like phosphoesterase family protein